MRNIINSLGLTVLEPFLIKKLHTVSSAFQKGKYSNILRIYNAPYTGLHRSTVYGNVFRILCLIKMSNIKWKSEYLAIEPGLRTNNFSTADEKYLKKVIIHYLGDQEANFSDLKDDEYYEVDISKVSKLTLRLFPLIEQNYVEFEKEPKI